MKRKSHWLLNAASAARRGYSIINKYKRFRASPSNSMRSYGTATAIEETGHGGCEFVRCKRVYRGIPAVRKKINSRALSWEIYERLTCVSGNGKQKSTYIYMGDRDGILAFLTGTNLVNAVQGPTVQSMPSFFLRSIRLQCDVTNATNLPVQVCIEFYRCKMNQEADVVGWSPEDKWTQGMLAKFGSQAGGPLWPEVPYRVPGESPEFNAGWVLLKRKRMHMSPNSMVKVDGHFILNNLFNETAYTTYNPSVATNFYKFFQLVTHMAVVRVLGYPAGRDEGNIEYAGSKLFILLKKTIYGNALVDFGRREACIDAVPDQVGGPVKEFIQETGNLVVSSVAPGS